MPVTRVYKRNSLTTGHGVIPTFNSQSRQKATYLIGIFLNKTPTLSRIHPLMAAAAVSVTLVSLVGIAAITNLLPSSHGSSADTASPISLAAPVAAPLAEATIRNNHETLRNKPVAHQNAPTPSHPPAAPVAQISPVGIGVGAVIGG